MFLCKFLVNYYSFTLAITNCDITNCYQYVNKTDEIKECGHKKSIQNYKTVTKK